MDTKIFVKSRWVACCSNIFADFGDSDKIEHIWAQIDGHYSEPTRFYHTLEHVQNLLQKREENSFVSDTVAVDLAIIFHDIIYDPRSKQNEKESAELFGILCAAHFNSDLVSKVQHYIMETKDHNVLGSMDADLKLFIDLDMSILGEELYVYRSYAAAIRQEYIFVEEQTYCKSRADFLRQFLMKYEFIFASEQLRERYEVQARSNISWECEQLDSSHIPST